MSFSPETITAAIDHLHDADPVMGKLIGQVGPFTLRPERDRFRLLVRSIVSQQISTKAARSIRARLEGLLPRGQIIAENLARLTPEEIRSAGLSQRKAEYVLDLSRRVLDGRLRIRQLGRLSDEAVIEQLIQVKGIGRWTAQMFLIFSLGRLDVFPHDDLGVRTAIRSLYRLGELPDKKTSHRIAGPWRPYATVASWYCWRHSDGAQDEKNDWSNYPV